MILGGVALVAGCTSGTDNSDSTLTNAPTNTAASSNDALKTQALALYTSKPFNTNTPEHSWLETSDGRLTFLHWNDADPAKATGLMFTGDGFKGKFCVGDAGVTKEEYDAGFVHFHSANAANWDAGHNAAGADGNPDTDGWWLRHIGAGTMQMEMMGMPMDIKKGEVFPLMAADFASLKPCAHGAGHGGEGDLNAQLLALYTSKPFNTNTPEHSWLVTEDDRMTFLHWNHPDPAQATGLLFTGEGFKGKFCLGAAGVTQQEYDDGFVHFHSANAANWDAGHNAAGADGAPTTDGWWLRHIGAGDMTMNMMGEQMTIEKGKVFPLMAAGSENLQPCPA